MVDTLLSKVIGWIDSIFEFARQYSDIIVYGVVAMMIAKMAKFNVRLGGK